METRSKRLRKTNLHYAFLLTHAFISRFIKTCYESARTIAITEIRIAIIEYYFVI